MNPADLTLPTLSPAIATKNLPTPQSSVQKNGKTPVPRVDLEPIYTQLKAGLGEHWTEYKTAVNQFVLGNLNQPELSWVLQPILTPAPTVLPSTSTANDPAFHPAVSTLHLHNTLLVSLLANIYRDPPPSDVAPWVVATDKPAASAKTAGGASSGANDKTEERMKRETMALHARDRRRLKTLGKDGGGVGGGEAAPVNHGFREMQDYAHALAAKQPSAAAAADIPPPSGGGLANMNRDLEIRRRYAQPLAAETLEFPSQAEIQARMEPICAEAGLVGGTTQSAYASCAELVEQATEGYIKEILGRWMAHTRSNAEGCIQTAGFRRQLRKEERDVERGVLQRGVGGLLPVELEAQGRRRPMGLQDLRTALQLRDAFLRRSRFLEEMVALGRSPEFGARDVGSQAVAAVVNGSRVAGSARGAVGEEQGEVEEYWKGGGSAGQAELMGVLDDCLAIG